MISSGRISFTKSCELRKKKSARRDCADLSIFRTLVSVLVDCGRCHYRNCYFHDSRFRWTENQDHWNSLHD
jgi:hypothetical protein